jgi:hypothetical protein
VYAGEEDQYFTFITPEAYYALEGWMHYRRDSGEPINEKSWLMRDLWDVLTPKGTGMATAPKRLKSSGVKRLVERALWAQGVRKPLEAGQRRHEFQADHGMRKWFKTRCEIAGVKPINVEELMSHSTGVSDSYYRITEEELLSDYLKAVPALTINDEGRLRMELAEAQKDVANLAIMQSDLREKDRTIELLMSRQANLEQFVQSLVDEGVLKPVK